MNLRRYIATKRDTEGQRPINAAPWTHADPLSRRVLIVLWVIRPNTGIFSTRPPTQAVTFWLMLAWTTWAPAPN